MNLRAAIAVFIGLALGLFISAFTYFNDGVIRQTMFIGNHLPIAVFALAVVLLLAVNPLLRLAGRAWTLSTTQIAIIVAVALASCAWPGSNLFRVFTPIVATPAHWLKTNASWQGAQVMSYVPGAAQEVAAGQVRDWPGLAQRLAEAAETAGHPLHHVWDKLAAPVQRSLRQAGQVGRVEDSDRLRVLGAINECVTQVQRPNQPVFWQLDAIHEMVVSASPASTLQTRRERAWTGMVELVGHGPDQPAPTTSAGQVGALTAQRQALIDQLAPQRQPLETRLQELARELGELERQRVAVREQIVERTARDENDPQLASLRAQAADLEARMRPLERQRKQTNDQRTRLLRPLRQVEHDLRVTQLRAQQHRDEVAYLDTALNRLAMVRLLPEHVAEAPAGEGWLLAHGQVDPLGSDPLIQGWDGQQTLKLSELPWRTWWPTLRLWGGMVLLLGVAVLCLSMIVHPQWSRRELLPYPIARFIEEASEPSSRGWLPAIAQNRLFWYGMGALLALHTINGLGAWFPDFVQVPLGLDLGPLASLFPNARRAPMAYGVWYPKIYLSVVAFAFFLTTQVSFSVGIALYFWVALGALLIANGVPLENEYLGAKKGNLLRFGGYVGMALVILYVGRAYYANVALSTFGLRRRATETPAYAPWAARILIVSLVLATWLISAAGLDPLMSVGCILMLMLTFLVMSRIVAETGLFFIQTQWLPVGVLTALFGIEAIGPTTYIVLGLASTMLVGDPRETLMPYLSNAFQIADRTGKVGPARVAPWLLVMIVVGFLTAMLVTWHFQYNGGLNRADSWAMRILPSMPFDNLTLYTSELTARGTLTESNELSGLSRLGAIRPDAGAIWWAMLGLVFVIGTAMARLRLPWWPLHPVLFLVWGTNPNAHFAFSFLLGWAVKAAVVKTGGAKGYHAVRPLMIGIIAGELMAALIWTIVGAIYFSATGTVPPRYPIFPG